MSVLLVSEVSSRHWNLKIANVKLNLVGVL